MKVKELASREVRSCRKVDGLDVAARMMAAGDLGCVPVVDEQERPIAVVTDRDVCLAALREGRPIAEIPVERAMSADLHAVAEDADVEVALDLMQWRQVRRLPVVDDAGRLTGLLSLDDLALALGRARGLFAKPVRAEQVGNALAAICRPHLVGAGV